MTTATAPKPLPALTASDLMSRKVICLHEDTAVREAVRQLLEHQIGGAPVVDADGRCVGVFSSADFLRLAYQHPDIACPHGPVLPLACRFAVKQLAAGGEEITTCALPPGTCPAQSPRVEPDGQEILRCTQPHCVLADWQLVDLEKLPDEAVARHMTANPVTVLPRTPVRVLAGHMVNAHIHRLIVVDEWQRPVGIVAMTDLLAALARGDP